MTQQWNSRDFNSADAEVILSTLEWKVVSLALREACEHGPADVLPPSRFGLAFRRVARALTGWEAKKPLADPRLETLRRFIFLVRWGHRKAEELAAKLLTLGYTDRQVRAVALLAGR